MAEINSLSGNCYDKYGTTVPRQENDDIELENISILYTTEKQEDERTTFSQTFSEKNIEETEFGEAFLNGLIDNKDDLSSRLGLSSEEYDKLACISLALASQETGFGEEDGFKSENEGLGHFVRSFLKKIHSIFGGGSSSSGLTQIKINDFLNGDVLTDEQKQVLNDFGVESTGVSKNNLYSEPDKSAIATMVVLTALFDNYDNYVDKLEKENQNISKQLNDGLSDEQKYQKGLDVLNNIKDVYDTSTNEEKEEIRTTFKQWMLSQNGSVKGDKIEEDYNEEIQLNKLNELLSEKNPEIKILQSDLDYIRYFLTADGQEMTKTQYCAYAWNKGTEETGMQLDRLLADKIGTILTDPESFDYDQFTVNVTRLAEKYEAQALK